MAINLLDLKKKHCKHLTLMAVGRDDHHLTEVGNGRHKVADAWGGDAVVVGDEDEGAGSGVAHVVKLPGCGSTPRGNSPRTFGQN